MRLIPVAAATALALALSACGSPPEDKAAEETAATTSTTTAEASPAAAVADAGGKPAAFAQCAASLAGVYGTKSGELAGYAFSDAMKQANLTWDDKTLDTYLTNPMKVVPGTKMTYAGLADPAQRKAIIEYLKTLK